MKNVLFILVSVLSGGAIGFGLFQSIPTLHGEQRVTETTPTVTAPSNTSIKYSTFSYNDGISKVAPSVVSIYSSETIYKSPVEVIQGDEEFPSIAPRERRSTSQGSGVIIDSTGLVLTNWHLVNTADLINVVLSDGSLHSAEIIGSDIETDLAVVRIPVRGLPAVEIPDDVALRVGDIVLAIGNPFGVGQTITQGIISATARRVAGASAWQNFVQVDAAINPGNSGGALISPDGVLVGINAAVFSRETDAEGIGYAIPAELLRQVVPQLVENGHVTRGWLGIGADDLPMFPGINRRAISGAVVTGVLEDSPAHMAGLEAFDVIVSAGGRSVVNATDLLLYVSSLPPGTQLELQVLRGEDEIRLPATLRERPFVDNNSER